MQHWKDLGTAKRAWWILMTSEDYTCGPRFCSNRPKELVPSPISYWPSSSFNDRYQGEEIVWLHQTTNKISYRSKELSFIQAVNACKTLTAVILLHMITVFLFPKIVLATIVMWNQIWVQRIIFLNFCSLSCMKITSLWYHKYLFKSQMINQLQVLND